MPGGRGFGRPHCRFSEARFPRFRFHLVTSGETGKDFFPMEPFRKAIVLDNEIQARRLAGVLAERDIPHFLRSYDDLAYGGIFQTQKGWGQLEVPERFHREVKAIFADLIDPKDPQPGDADRA